MNRLHRSSVNMVSSAAGYVVPMLANLIATPLLLRGLGEAAFGLQSLVAVIIGYLTMMDMGLALPIIKLLAEDRAKNDIEAENRMLSTTLQLYGAIGIVGMVVIVLAADWFARSVFKVPTELIPQATLVFRLAGIGFLGSMGMSWGQALAMGLQRFEISYGVSAVSNVAGVGLGLVMVYAGYGVVGYVLVRVITSLSSGPAYWLLARRLLPTFRVKWGIDRATLRRVRGYVGCGVINRATSSLVSRLDQTLIGVWLGVAAAGVYSVSFLVVNSLGYMISYMLGFIFPLASELQSLGNMDRLRDIFTRATRFITALAGMIFVPLFVLGDIFLTLWVPSIAGQAAVVLRLLTLAGYLGTLCASLTNNAVIGMGHIRQFTIYATIRSIVLGASCLLLIRRFGLEGAGWALLVTEIVDGVYLFVALRNYLQIKPLAIFRTAYLKPMVLGVMLGAVVWLARPLAHSWLGLTGVVGLLELIYISVGYWIGIFGETEKRVVTDFWEMVAGKSSRWRKSR